MAFLTLIAFLGEWKKHLANNPVVYALSLTIYFTSWTYFGSIGMAATSGMYFLTLDMGLTASIALWCIVLPRLIRIKNAYHITSIADFLSARYEKSGGIAALATVIALLGLIPYIGLQLRTIFSAFSLMTSSSNAAFPHIDFIVVGLTIIFIIGLGARRLDPTERHPGMVLAVGAEAIVKLIAFVMASIFITFYLFPGGLVGLFPHLSSPIKYYPPSYYYQWTDNLILGMFTILLLPRQFHMAVVENSDENHVKTAMWLLPLYSFVLHFLVFPVAMVGLLKHYPLSQADTFILRLPLDFGPPWLILMIFLGGISTSLGMISISSMTIATMVSNHLVLPVSSWRPLRFLKKHVLQIRWLAISLLILFSYEFQLRINHSYMLVKLGSSSFSAILQFAPAAVGGIFWRKGNKVGAFLGLSMGILTWLYTSIFPTFIKSGWFHKAILENGPWGLTFLKPEGLFGMSGLDPLSHTIFWSMLFNIGLYVLGSLLFEQSQDEREIAENFTQNLAIAPPPPLRLGLEEHIPSPEKAKLIEKMFSQYLSPADAANKTEKCLQAASIQGKPMLSIIDLAEFYKEAEKTLAGSIGAPEAHRAIKQARIFKGEETKEIKEAYSKILAQLKLTPEELRRRIDYYQEKESLLTSHAMALEKQIRKLEIEINRRQEAENALKKAHDELEMRVAERTAELADANRALQSDIQEREKAEEALVNSERKLADIINFLPDATFVIDAEGHVIAWNKALEELTGIKAEEMLGKANNDYAIRLYGKRRATLADQALHPAQENKEIEKEYLYLEQKKGVFIGEIYSGTIKPGGIYLWIKATPLYDARGKIVGAIESLRDISERKRAEEEKAKLQQQQIETLKQADSLKDQFLSILSHELRTPLNSITGFGSILDDELFGPLTPQQHKYLKKMLEETDNLLVLVNDLLDLTRVQAGKFTVSLQPTNFSALADNVIETLTPIAARKSLTLHNEVPRNLPQVLADDLRITQVISNLINNAIKFTPIGGNIWLRASVEGIFLRCEVADSGIGIAQEDIPKLFQRFTQLDMSTTRKVGGAGLGLSISKAIIDAHKGQIGVTSVLGKGSVFWFTLPLVSTTVEK